MCVLKIRIFGCWQVVLSIALCSWAVPSKAWRVSDHELITKRAVQLYERCHNLRFTATEVNSLVKGSSSEDFNLVVKWLKNSHYYNPTKWVRTLYRDDAGYRVQHLTEKLLAGRQPQLLILGKILHFVQDVTSPTHVVPIVHGLGDGFEKFKMPAAATAKLNLPCPPAKASSPQVVLKREALQTLASIRNKEQATRDGKPYVFTWTLFWSEGLGSKFGYYGFFGNSFGETKPIEIMGRVYRFSHQVFHNYKLARANQAIVASSEIIHWYRTQVAANRNLLIEKATFLGVIRWYRMHAAVTAND